MYPICILMEIERTSNFRVRIGAHVDLSSRIIPNIGHIVKWFV